MTAAKTKTVPDIVVTLDLGASRTKAIAQQFGNAAPVVVSMEPELADISSESVKDLNSEGIPENSCWVEVPGVDHFAVGYLARTRFGGISQLRDLKYELAVPKIAGVLWVLQQKLGLAARFSVSMSLLLPPGEVSQHDKVLLLSKLAASLAKFDTPSGQLRVKIVDFELMPEGGGVFGYRVGQLGADYKQKTIALVMLGYRNASCFICDRGNLKPGTSSDLGMFWMVNNFVGRAKGGLSRDDLQVVQALVGAGANGNLEVLQGLSRKRSANDIRIDGEAFAAAARISRDEYARAVVRWIKSLAPTELDEAILTGGTAEYVAPELDAYFAKEGITVIWNGGVMVSPDLLAGESLSRYADAWSLHAKSFERFSAKYKIPTFSNPTPSVAAKKASNVAVNNSPERNDVSDGNNTSTSNGNSAKKQITKYVRPKDFIEMPDKL
ncbi:MAG: hypothetical protein CLLPBCKN_007652 [Chroococcidiopsis cubana SAG 39.79]|uniref:Actin-like protein N-terminal domain-containing protein n=1 Tax=Chroococcidiopsis cubana SAG 39.79 TaxID=388085 RepID=A0AB37USY3_9CYAN|nr:ParM/StbA family protein [Chroococcidiopsis cubana]MDZ4878217.1 hypothetical protein [Chroococcidiopsis cubana SAG 39.79]RUT14524.1 hypothetical protein DSM107010_00700 [Chroococcidiopsis cubana SAG 39.79]